MSKTHVVYTCITGGYDSLREVKFRSRDVDYICFTDNANLKSSTWEIRPLPETVVSSSDKALTSVKKQRLIKLLPHKFLSEYADSLWVDSNIELIGDLTDFFKQYSFSEKFLYTNKHPTRNCAYDEELACLRLKKDSYENMQPQMDKYLAEGFPKHYGLAETNLLLRNHNDPKCKKLMSLWAEEILDGSHRDQLSYNYCVWKLGLESSVGYLSEKYANLKYSDNAFFKLIGGHVKISDYVPFSSSKNAQSDKVEVFVERTPEVVKNEDSKPESTVSDASVKKKKNPFDFMKVTWDRSSDVISLETVDKPIAPIEKKPPEKKVELAEAPFVSVVFFTHERTRVAKYCLKKLVENLKYEKLRWVLSDDRSHEGHVEELLEVLKSHGIEDVAVCRTSESRHGLGASMNNGLKEAFKTSEVVLRVEDDWLLEKPLDLKRHVETLMKNQRVAGIRIGMVGGGVDEERGRLYPGYKTLCGGNVKSWLFVNQVFLVHKRVHDALGWYSEDGNADKVEVDFKERYNKYSSNGHQRMFVLVPREMKWRTFDDPSLWFIHVGRSMLGHAIYRPPKRYEWLYNSPEDIAERKAREEANRVDVKTVLLDKLVKSIGTKKTEEKKVEPKKAELKLVAAEKPKTVEAKPIIESKKKEVEWPTISVMMTTHNRTNVARVVIDSLCSNLQYSGKIHWIISDDRSSSDHVPILIEQFKQHGIVPETCFTDSVHFGLGASLNNGLKKAFSYSDIVLTTEDDWILQKKLNLDIHVSTISSKNVAAIRLGALRGGKAVSSKKFDEYYIVKEQIGKVDYIFNNQVALRHKRIFDKLGFYVESNDNNFPEKDMSLRYNRMVSPSKTDDYAVLFPKSLKTKTIDDPSLYFIHVGKSTIGSREVVPKRYEWLYENKMTIAQISERRKVSSKTTYIVANQLDSLVNEPIDSYTFFSFLQKKEIPSVYLISSKHIFAEELRKKSIKNVVYLDNPLNEAEFLSKCGEALVHCKAYVAEGCACNQHVYEFLKISQIKTVFMEHGITNNWESNFLANLQSKFKIVNVSSEFEKHTIENMVRKYGYNVPKFVYGGLPRYDVIENDGASHRSALVMFSCRPSLSRSIDKFKTSAYFRNLKSLLDRLVKMVETGKLRKVYLALHHQYVNRLPTIKSLFTEYGSAIEIVKTDKISEAIKNSSILVTDLSSVSFDFLFFEKPVVFWPLDYGDLSLSSEDREKVSTSKNLVSKSLFNVVQSCDSVVSLVEKYADSDFSLEDSNKKVASKFFMHKQNICECLYNGIENA